MSVPLEYSKITEARANFRSIYDSAERHIPALVRRENDAPVAVIRSDDLKRALGALCPVDPQVRFADDGQVSAWIDGLPVSAEGADLDSVEDALIQALREYSQTWVDELRHYPNHEHFWGLVNLVLLSDDLELRTHLFGSD